MKHCFDDEVAADLGVNAAILFEYISYWVGQNLKSGKNYRDGKHWTYGSVREIADRFSYLSEKQVRGAIERLLDAGLIKAGNYNKAKYDRTRWFTLTDEGERISQKNKIVKPMMAKGKVKIGKPIPINKKHLNITNIKPERIEHIRKICGIVEQSARQY